MNYKLLTVSEACKALRWCESTYHTRRGAGLFPMPFKIAGSKRAIFILSTRLRNTLNALCTFPAKHNSRSLLRRLKQAASIWQLN